MFCSPRCSFLVDCIYSAPSATPTHSKSLSNPCVCACQLQWNTPKHPQTIPQTPKKSHSTITKTQLFLSFSLSTFIHTLPNVYGFLSKKENEASFSFDNSLQKTPTTTPHPSWEKLSNSLQTTLPHTPPGGKKKKKIDYSARFCGFCRFPLIHPHTTPIMVPATTTTTKYLPDSIPPTDARKR